MLYDESNHTVLKTNFNNVNNYDRYFIVTSQIKLCCFFYLFEVTNVQ